MLIFYLFHTKPWLILKNQKSFDFYISLEVFYFKTFGLMESIQSCLECVWDMSGVWALQNNKGGLFAILRLKISYL